MHISMPPHLHHTDTFQDLIKINRARLAKAGITDIGQGAENIPLGHYPRKFGSTVVNPPKFVELAKKVYQILSAPERNLMIIINDDRQQPKAWVFELDNEIKFISPEMIGDDEYGTNYKIISQNYQRANLQIFLLTPADTDENKSRRSFFSRLFT